MLTKFVNAVAEHVGNLGAPLHDAAQTIQSAITSVVDPGARAGSERTTTVGKLATGPRPTAHQLRSHQLTTPGTPDMDRAQADAQRTLERIDFTRPDIVLWMPATFSHNIPSAWRNGVKEAFGDRASLALVDYPADANFLDSVATGQETLKLVLAGIAERGGDHRVTIGAHSQGAWVAGDAINDPVVGRMVDKAMLYGHPAPASVDWSSGAEPRVRQIDNPKDPFTWEVVGGRQALQAIDELHAGTKRDGTKLSLPDMVGRGMSIASVAIANPWLSSYLVSKHAVPADQQSGTDPHSYSAQYADGARQLAAR